MIIGHFKWGEVITSDGNTYKDAIIYNSGSVNWDWGVYGLCHNPGYDGHVLAKIFRGLNPVYPAIPPNFKIFLSLGVDMKIRAPHPAQALITTGARFNGHVVYASKREVI